MQMNLPFVAGSSLIAVPRNRVIARIIKALAILLTVALSITSATAARKKGPGSFNKIVDVDPVSITISLGTDGNTHQKYAITDSTKVTLNGAPANSRDLRSGMIAHIDFSADGKTAETITAKDAPAHPAAHRTG
jgi:hypothetical protein